ncbi:MAG: DNA polymerase III subunit beta [Pseudomonadota bacterium]
MKIKVNRSDILPSLNLVSSVVEKRQTLPILANLFFSVEAGVLKMVGTDLEVEITESVNKVAGDDGVFTVSSRKIQDIVRMLPENADISLKLDKENVVVTSGRSRYTLKTLPADDFPRIEIGNWEERFKIDQSVLKRLLDKTAFAMAVQDVRYYLNGVLFELSQNNLRAIATDGHRLAQSDVDIDLSINDTRQLIVPRKAIAEINRFVGGDDDSEVTVEINKNHLKLSKGDTVLITKLIDGKFPEFKGVLETTMETTVSLDRTTFIDTMNRAAVLTTDRFRGVKLTLEDNTLRITANNPEQEEAVEEMEINHEGGKIETGYNVGYLIDAAKVAGGESIDLHLQGNDGISIIRQNDDPRSVWLIMPMRI